MENLSTTVAVYDDLDTAERDWETLETAAADENIELADAALLRRDEGGVTPLRRQSHHGWGKGAVAGAVVGLLFPPAILAGAVVGAGGGAVIARLNRSLDRDDIKELGDAMDSGEIAIVVLTDEQSVSTLVDIILEHASRTLTKGGATAEEVREALDEDEAASPSS